ncbi:MAG: hypothetical protein DWH91_03015 [Planctomycetota bacterium]|nr:MAG: hypothetical protein DWH91_03015 [Planctomycetota bacterium]
MRFASTGNQLPTMTDAVTEAVSQLRQQLQGAEPDLVFFFATPHHGTSPGIGGQLQMALGARVVLGCTAESVLANHEEYENGPALSVWAAVLPGSMIEAFHITFERTPDGLLATGAPSAETLDQTPRAAILLGDPFTCPVDSLLGHFAAEIPGLPVLGGMASGASAPGENRLYLNDQEYDHGVVGVVLGGAIQIRSVVSQGCRPVGQPYVVTRSNRNVIQELGGRPALEQLNQLYRESSPEVRHLIQQGIHVGIAISEFRERFERGDFLIANFVGADREHGSMAIGHLIRTGQTVQFHVRDANTADEDLRSLLTQALAGGAVTGGLLFSCNGRGTRLFATPHHDARTIQELAGGVPLAGFFAQGELGPVAGRNYIHGYTASLALFSLPENPG